MYEDPILRNIKSDQWSNTTMALILIFFGIATFLIIALAAQQDSKQILPALFFTAAFLGGWIALLGTVALGDRSPFQLSGFGSPIQIKGFQLLARMGTPLRVFLGFVAGILLYGVVVAIVGLLSVDTTQNLSPGNILPFASIINLSPVFSYAYTILFSPVLETIFLVSVLFSSIKSNIIKYTSVGRIVSSVPFVGSFTLVFTITLFVAAIFTILHTYSYSGQLNASDPNFINLLVKNLLTIDIVCVFWILGMQLTGTIMTPLTMHIIQNWIALGDLLRASGKILTIFDLFMYVIIPLVIIFFISSVLNMFIGRGRSYSTS